MKTLHKSSVLNIIYFFFSTFILYLGFFTNFWHVANDKWFEFQNYDMESFIIGRIVKSNQDGIFSSGGLTGIGSPNSDKADFNNRSFDFQREAYINGLFFESFNPYYSQIGGQGILFSIFDRAILLPPQTKLNIYQAFTSIITAITISLAIFWFYCEFGFIVSLFVLITTALSPWLVVFGGKLWWSTWSFYLPMIVVFYYLKKKEFTTNNYLILGLLSFIFIFIKCLFSGYEYITTTLIMMMVPFIFYSTKQKQPFKNFFFGVLMLFLGSMLAIIVSFLLLSFQIGITTGSPLNGVFHIADAFRRRTVGGSEIFSTLDVNNIPSNSIAVLISYLKGGYFGPKELLLNFNPIISFILSKISYLYLIILFGILSIFILTYKKYFPRHEDQNRIIALVSTLWFSLLAPLSWFLIFKEHSIIHTHMNYVVWQMPFTFFGFALCGYVLLPLFKKSTNSHL